MMEVQHPFEFAGVVHFHQYVHIEMHGQAGQLIDRRIAQSRHY